MEEGRTAAGKAFNGDARAAPTRLDIPALKQMPRRKPGLCSSGRAPKTTAPLPNRSAVGLTDAATFTVSFLDLVMSWS